MSQNQDMDEDEFLENLKKTFLEEATFLVEDFESQLMELETTPDRDGVLGNIFRIAHSIKGSGASVGFDKLSGFTHTVEDFLSVLRTHPEEINPEVITLLLDSCDKVKGMVADLIDPQDDTEVWQVQELETQLKKATAAVENPSEPAKFGEVLLKQGNVDQSNLDKALDQQSKDREKKLGDYLIENGAATKEDVEKAVKTQEQKNKKFKETKSSTLLKIDSERVDGVMNLVGELVVIKSLLMQNTVTNRNADNDAAAMVSLLDKTVRDLYDKALSMRMTSLKGLFMKMQRTVRDLSTKLNKPVDFVSQGENTELDRAIIEQLNNPLVHICRNAIDHGLENEDKRKESGKDPKGTITLSAKNEGGNVIIEVCDDGGGIDKSKVFEKAKNKGLIPASSDEASYEDNEIFGFLFHPGFSTAKAITDVSGRGVGLDVVKTAVEDLKGQITINSTPHKGTTFRLTLPLTTAITDGILISAASEKYILPMEVIREFIKKDRVTITKVEGQCEMLEMRGEFIPLVRIGKILSGIEDGSGLIAIVDTREGKIGLLVSEVLGHNQVVLKILDERMGEPEGVSGAAILGDGKVGLVLDVNSIYDLSKRSYHKAAAN